MKLIIYTYPPDGSTLESRMPTDEETAPLMIRLFRLIQAVKKLLPYETHWSVWLLTGKGEKIGANVTVESIGTSSPSFSSGMQDSSFPVCLASADTSISAIEITEEAAQKQAQEIADKLNQKLLARQQK